MARYLVIEFEDNADCDKLIEFINQGTLAGALYRVVGVFVRPGKTCQCGDRSRINYGDKMHEHGIKRGEKFGWWVCTRCNKPRNGGHQLVNQLLPSETHALSKDEYEMTVSGLQVGGILRKNINRPKQLKQALKRRLSHG